MRIVETLRDIQSHLQTQGGSHYLYVLRLPDQVFAHGATGTPFYVGRGQRDRVLLHEKEARQSSASNIKLDTIRSIWAKGGEVRRTIASVHGHDPALEEAELINLIGTIRAGTGPLANDQNYAPANFLDGKVTRKYLARVQAAGGIDVLPADFSLHGIRLMAGPIKPTSPRSVAGMIYEAANIYAGETGAEIHARLMERDFSHIKSAYVVDGRVCAIWLADWMHGVFHYKKALHIQKFAANSVAPA